MKKIEKIEIDNSIYNFIVDNFPWNWGTYEKFVWKHYEDALGDKNCCFRIMNENEVESLCVAKVYPIIYKKNVYRVLNMMDFATNEKYKNQGNITMLSEYIQNNLDYDYAIGYSSKELKSKVYKKKETLQVYYNYQVKWKRKAIKYRIVTDLDLISKYLNENENGMLIHRDERYMKYILSNPDLGELIYVTDGQLLIGIDIKTNLVKIIDISQYDYENCMRAIELAAQFNENVQVDMPSMINNKFFSLKKEIHVSMYSKIKDFSIKGGENIWIPYLDRK